MSKSTVLLLTKVMMTTRFNKKTIWFLLILNKISTKSDRIMQTVKGNLYKTIANKGLRNRLVNKSIIVRTASIRM